MATTATPDAGAPVGRVGRYRWVICGLLIEPEKLNASLRALTDAVYSNYMIVDGLEYITTDELHAYGRNSIRTPSGFISIRGEPRAIKRLRH